MEYHHFHETSFWKHMNYKLFLFVILLLFCSSDHATAYIYDEETPLVDYLKELPSTVSPSGVELIDCIYVINMDHQKDKWNRIKELLQSHQLNFNRVSAINGWLLSEAQQIQLSGDYPLRLKGGQVGCLLSHISILKDALAQDFEYVWLMEDDIDIIDDIQLIPELMKELNQIDPDWDILYTDLNSKNENGEYVYSLSSDFRPDRDHEPVSYYVSNRIISENLQEIHQRFGTYSYIVSRKGMEKIFHYFTHVYLWTMYDIDLHYIPGIREYCPTKEIVSIRYQIPVSDTTKP